MNEANVSVYSEEVCHLGEGPTCDPVTGTVYWFDIVERRMLQKSWPDGPTLVQALPEMASATAFTRDRTQVLLTESGLYIRDRVGGGLILLQPVEAGNPATRSNDARVHASGAFWISTMGKQAETGAGSIYWYREGELRLLFPGISVPNSICFSPAGDIAYYADTRLNRLFRVECDPATGLPTGEPAVFLDQGGQQGGIDGSVCDAEGLIWNARWGAGALDCYAPDGRHVRRIDIPATRPSCPAFAGPDADRIVVTSAWQGLDEAARQADPLAGQTFLVDLPVKGRHEPLLLA